GLSIVEGKFSDTYVNCFKLLSLINTAIIPFINNKVFSKERLEAETASQTVEKIYSKISLKCLKHLKAEFEKLTVSSAVMEKATLVGGNLPEKGKVLRFKLIEQKKIFEEKITQSDNDKLFKPDAYEALFAFSKTLDELKGEIDAFEKEVGTSLDG